MERKISLNGEWKLYYSDEINGKAPDECMLESSGIPCIRATVPGNTHLDLSAAGELPGDLYRGMATEQARRFEGYGFWYCKSFRTPEFSENERVILQFEGVDCVAEYYINGELADKSENAFIPHELDITGRLAATGENRLTVHILSSMKAELETPYPGHMLYGWKFSGAMSLRLPVHSFGWDIMPRAVSGGLWRDVNIVVRDEYSFENVYYHVTMDEDRYPSLEFFITVNAPAAALMSGSLSVRVKGFCGGDSEITGQYSLKSRKICRFTCHIDNPKLWWPYGYGAANVYDTEVMLCSGDTVFACEKLNVGLRTLKLDRTATLNEPDARFNFIINGETVFCRGSNWVPMDAYHSRDNSRYERALGLASDIGCNMLRVWGGGVYEGDFFYDYCDRHGIMVWQDFMFACQLCPMTEKMMKNIENEAVTVIRALRNHPSLVLWAGDNELDECYSVHYLDTDRNRISRELLPRLVWENDAFRPYLQSSPYVPGELSFEYRTNKDIFVERHMWGARDYFKSRFYSESRACFISETGYHGCPSAGSVKRIVDDDCVWPCNNEQWTLHSSDQNGNDSRVRLMEDQIRQLFGIKAGSLGDFVFTSQISQAEADKYLIERMRCKRPYTGGILWWNLIDGWPQMSDAVVDYFYVKKIAYDYIKRAQAPVALIIDEMEDWHYTLVCANDTLEPVSGSYTVSDIETGSALASGNFKAGANTTTQLAKIRMYYSDQSMLLIKWSINGKTYFNHYLCGMPPFSPERYKRQYDILNESCSGES